MYCSHTLLQAEDDATNPPLHEYKVFAVPPMRLPQYLPLERPEQGLELDCAVKKHSREAQVYVFVPDTSAFCSMTLTVEEPTAVMTATWP